MRVLLTAFLLLFAASASAQDLPPDSPRFGSISGTVTSTTGSPIKNVPTMILSIDPNLSGLPSGLRAQTVTDEQGRFHFEQLAPGAYFVVAKSPDYVVPAFVPSTFADKNLIHILSSDQQLDINIRLQPLGSISGRVSDDSGDPLARYVVTVERMTYISGLRQTEPVARGVSNDLGQYLIEDVPPGRYFIHASSPQENHRQGSIIRALKPSEADLRWDEAFYPNAGELSNAGTILMTAGQQLDRIDIEVSPHQYFPVRGRVINFEHPVQSSRVNFKSHSPFAPFSAGVVPQEDGSFELPGVPSGKAMLYYWHEDPLGGKRSILGRTPIEVLNEPLENIIVNSHVGEISGSIRLDISSDASTATATPKISIAFQAAEQPLWEVGRAESDGDFSIPDLAHGRYLIAVTQLPRGFYVKEMRLAGASILDTVLDLSGSFPEGRMEIVLSPNAATITGTVRTKDGKPGGGATVTLVPVQRRFGQARLYPLTTASANGNFRFDSVVPGRYEVFAWESVAPPSNAQYSDQRMEDTAHWNEDFLRPFLARGEVVTVKEKETENLSLSIITAQEMEEALMRVGL